MTEIIENLNDRNTDLEIKTIETDDSVTVEKEEVKVDSKIVATSEKMEINNRDNTKEVISTEKTDKNNWQISPNLSDSKLKQVTEIIEDLNDGKNIALEIKTMETDDNNTVETPQKKVVEVDNKKVEKPEEKEVEVSQD